MTTEDIHATFTYHAPRTDQTPRYEKIRETAKNFALMLVDACPQSRELSIAHTKLQEVVMFANAAIAINE